MQVLHQVTAQDGENSPPILAPQIRKVPKREETLYFEDSKKQWELALQELGGSRLHPFTISENLSALS